MARHKTARTRAAKGSKAARTRPKQIHAEASAAERMLAENRRLARARGIAKGVQLVAWVTSAIVVGWVCLDVTGASFGSGLILLVVIWLVATTVLQELRLRQTVSSADYAPAGFQNRAPRKAPTEQELALQRALGEAARRLRRLYHVSILTAIACLTAPMPIALVLFPDGGPGAALACLSAGCVFGAMLLGRIYVIGNRIAKDVQKLVNQAGVEAAGAIVDFLCSSDEALHAPAVVALRRLLDRMRPTDTHLLDANQRRYLYGLLTPDRARESPAFAISILGMIEQIRDPAAEPYLRELLAMPTPQTEQDHNLLRSAFHALHSLETAEAELTLRGTLLSPASAPDNAAEILLRARGAGMNQPPDQLLRTAELDARD